MTTRVQRTCCRYISCKCVGGYFLWTVLGIYERIETHKKKNQTDGRNDDVSFKYYKNNNGNEK